MNTNDTLPELSDARVAEIETQLFDAIREEGRDDLTSARDDRRRRARRGRLWLAGGAAAAVIVVAAVIAPHLGGLGVGTSGAQSDAAPEIVPNSAPGFSGADGGALEGDAGAAADDETAPDEAGGAREIIATASATVRVEDVRVASDRIAGIAAAAGGYVETSSIGANDAALQQERYDSGLTVPYPQTSTWMSVRVPAAQLDAAIASLSDVGEVTATQLDRRDVTGEAVDLRARIDAMRTSVERLESLMADAESTADLLAAEAALAERQAQLESYEQQLTYLEDQVGMSSLTVSLYEPAEVVTADPAGFGDGVTAGWNGLVATLNGIVIALGFLLPWLVVIAVIGLAVWLVRRAVRRRRSDASTDADADPDRAS